MNEQRQRQVEELYQRCNEVVALIDALIPQIKGFPADCFEPGSTKNMPTEPRAVFLALSQYKQQTIEFRDALILD